MPSSRNLLLRPSITVDHDLIKPAAAGALVLREEAGGVQESAGLCRTVQDCAGE